METVGLNALPMSGAKPLTQSQSTLCERWSSQTHTDPKFKLQLWDISGIKQRADRE